MGSIKVELSDTKGDQWNNLAKDYEQRTVEVSSGPIKFMLEKADALRPFSDAIGILDNGCGPGPVMSQLLKGYKIPDACNLTCSDFSEGMIKQVQSQKEQAVKSDPHSPWARVETVIQNAMDLQSVKDESQSHVTAGWVYFMTPDPQKCLSESKRVLVKDGVLSCSSWAGSSWLGMMQQVERVRPDLKLPELPPAWSSADRVKGELEKAGFADVEAHRVPTTMSFDKMDGLVDFMLEKMPHMVMLLKNVSDDDRGRIKELMIEEGLKAAGGKEPGELQGMALVAVGRR